MPYEVRDWYISGVHTGYRVIKGSGWDAAIAGGFAYNMYVDGAKEKMFRAALKMCDELNEDREV